MRISVDHFMLFVLFLVLPFFDAANGMLVINGIIAEGGVASPSQLGRALLLVLLVYMVYRERLSLVPFYLLFFFLSIEIIYGFLHQKTFGFLVGFSSTQKLIYIFLLASVLKSIISKGQPSQRIFFNLFQYNLLLISIFLCFSTITGIGNSTYGWGFGTKSFFSSGNGLGLYLGISTTLLIGVKKYFFSEINFYMLLFCSISVALIGTKTSFIFCILNLLLLLWNSKYKFFIVLIISIISPFIISPLIDSIYLLFDVVIARMNNSDSMLSFFGSGRIEYVRSAFSTFWESGGNAFRLLLGSGAFTSYQEVSRVKAFDTLETDLFDLLFMYGIIAILIYFFFSFLILSKIRKYSILVISFSFLLGHSIIAGHVLFNGMSSVCFAIFYAVAINVKRIVRC